MARTPTKNKQSGIGVGTAELRDRLPTRREPYWVEIAPGTAVGYYKGGRDVGWFVRQRIEGAYRKQRIGTPDDAVAADGDVVLTYRDAVKRAVNLQLEDRQLLPRHYGDGLTLNEVFDEYLADRQVTPGGRLNRVMAATTAVVSEQAWGRHARAGIGTRLVTALDAKTLKAWHAKMATIAPTVRYKVQPFDPADPEQVRGRRATANRILTIAKAALAWARQNDKLSNDMPDWWRNVPPFALGDDPVPRMLTNEEITLLLNTAPLDLREILKGALMTGARYGELGSLRVRDYDADHGTVRIDQHKTYKTLQQPLTGEGVALFDRLTAGRAKDAFLFTRADGSPWAKKDVIRPMRATVEATGLEDVSFKTTRATYGKLLLMATKDLELVAKALGHSDSRITRKHYAALLPSEVRAGIAMMPALGFDEDRKVSSIRARRRTAA